MYVNSKNMSKILAHMGLSHCSGSAWNSSCIGCRQILEHREIPGGGPHTLDGQVQNCDWDLRYLGAAGAPVIFSSSAATAARKLSGITFV
jgi:hypothetical protein